MSQIQCGWDTVYCGGGEVKRKLIVRPDGTATLIEYEEDVESEED